jgi:peptidoglycan/LPS O-acetylase OafA/YrhL
MEFSRQLAGSNTPDKTYRADIDGLRAIAVLAVIFFHINKQLMPGGFVGVDVFFVISGFLITRHIFNDLGRGTFSFLQFYCRRIKRIAPAMLVVLAVTLLAAQFLLLPEDAKIAAKSGVWSVASMANVYFWLFQDSSYFAASSSELPLLHLWSLGVEEQFYLVWPVLAWCVFSLRRRTLLIWLSISAAASFGLAESVFALDPSFTYYMLPARAGEFLVGVVAAILVESGITRRIGAHFATPITALGALLLTASLLFLSEGKIFPGLLAIPPTVGTGLIILGGTVRFNGISRLLSFKALTWVGAISYSAYLWHWPLLAFFRYGYGDPGVLAGALLFSLTILLAWLTYRYVEQPGRNIAAVKWRPILGSFIATSLVVAMLAASFVYVDRLPPSWRSSEYATALAAVRGLDLSTERFDYVCQRKQLSDADSTDKHCAMGSGDEEARHVLLMGDSNAAHFVGVVGAFAQQSGFRFLNLEAGSCPPLLTDISAFVSVKRLAACRASQQVWRKALLDAKVVIMGGTWNEYQSASAAFLPALFVQVQQLEASGKTVILMGKIPVINSFDRLCREKALRYPNRHCIAGPNAMSEEIAATNAQLEHFAAASRTVRYFDINAYLCPQGMCSAYSKQGDLLYFDKGHLSTAGSWEVGKAIYADGGLPPAFQDLGKQLPALN